MKKPVNIFLIGPMGAGKSTVGKHLASTLKMDFIDSDAEIQRRTGVDIPTIFEFEGEEGFRRREQAVIDELTQSQHQVLATGGGVVMSPENRRNLASRGYVIYLECSVDQQFDRTARDRNRRLLDTDEPRAGLEELLELREPLYREAADLVVSTEKRSAASVSREIVEALESL